MADATALNEQENESRESDDEERLIQAVMTIKLSEPDLVTAALHEKLNAEG